MSLAQRSGLGLSAALLLCTLATPARAEITVQLGLNMGELTGEQAQRDNTFRYGLVLGAGLVGWADNFGIEMDVQYIQKGTSVEVFHDYDKTPDDGVRTVKLDYIEIPILGMLALPLDDDIRLFGSLGVSLAFLVSASQEDDYKAAPDHEDSVWDVIAGFDLGIILGAGAQFDLFALEMRYEWGLLTTESQSFGGYVMNAERYNRSLTLLGSARF